MFKKLNVRFRWKADVHKYKCSVIFFAHNHPSGVAEPSLADKNITRRLQEALSLVDIRVRDHFIIGENTAISFAEQGLI